MNNQTALTPHSGTNLLSTLRAPPTKLAKTIARAPQSILAALKTKVAAKASVISAGLSLLGAACPQTLATEVVLRDTIHGTPATSQNAHWERGNQTLATQIPTVATFAVHLPENSDCKFSSFSFVFGSMSSIVAPDVFDWKEIFNTAADGTRTTDLRIEVMDGPKENLIQRMNGDIYSRSITKEEMMTTMPWGSTTNSYSGRPTAPYNMATILFPNINTISTGAKRTVYLKISFVKLQPKSTFGCLAVSTGEPVNGDVALGGGHIFAEPPSAYACKIVADITPRVPACKLEVVDGKMAVCWPTSYGTNFNVTYSTDIVGTWQPQPIEAMVLTDGIVHAQLGTNIDTGAGARYFRLESK